MKNLIFAVAAVVTLFSFAPAEASADYNYRAHRSSYSNYTPYRANVHRYNSGHNYKYQNRPSHSARIGHRNQYDYSPGRSYYNRGYGPSCGR